MEKEEEEGREGLACRRLAPVASVMATSAGGVEEKLGKLLFFWSERLQAPGARGPCSGGARGAADECCSRGGLRRG